MKKLILLVTFLLPLLVVLAQNKTITGKITDESGVPVAFATITETGTRNAVTTDANGNFSINVREGSRLTLSYTGYKSQTISPTGNSVNLVLEKAVVQLQELIVTSLGIRRADKALGYAVGKVDPASLLQKSEPDVLKTLQGKVAGVDIRNSQGTPGAATRIQIRGNSSFFGDNQPLLLLTAYLIVMTR